MYVTSTALAVRVFKRFQMSKDRTLVRALTFNQCGQSAILSRCHAHMCMGRVCRWFSPCSASFSPGTPVFLAPDNPTFPKPNSISREDPREN